MNYTSFIWKNSHCFPGARFRVRRLSLDGRMELMREVRGAGACIEFLQAGGDGLNRADAAIAAVEIDRIYVRWGLEEVCDLRIDGHPATVELLLERGPDALSREIAEAVRCAIFLSEEERKN